MNAPDFTAGYMNAYRQDDLHQASIDARVRRVSVADSMRTAQRFTVVSALRCRVASALRRAHRNTPVTARG